MEDSIPSSNNNSSKKHGQPSNPHRHPPNLRGKAIGLWYAQHQRSANSGQTPPNSRPPPSQPVATIELSPNEIQRVTKVRQLFKHHQPSRKPIQDSSSNIDDNKADNPSIDDIEHAIQFEKLHSSFQYFEPLNRQPEVDQNLFDDLRKKQSSSLYQNLFLKRSRLPITNYRQQILDTIEQNQIFILVGETGSGKTTQTAQFILDDQILKNKGSQCRIICSQPRRISATSVAERVAQERGERHPGDSVGYHIRLSAQLPRKNGSILFCTTGMLLKYIEKYLHFEHFSHLILDEIHERNIEMDFLLIFIKRLLTIRQDLKVILMSASIQAEKFSLYFNQCPILRIPGNIYPIKEYFLEDYITKLKYPYDNGINNHRSKRILKKETDEIDFNHYISELEFDLASQHKPIEVLKKLQAIGTDFGLEINCDLVVSVIELICRISSQGTILVFLPGWNEIVKCTHLLRQRTLLSSYLHILPLHSLLPLHNQQEIFAPPPHPSLRKVILSTAIAETSITIDDVIYVVDTGRTKASDYDLETQGKCLLPTNISRANLLQRKGRAGRTQPGECYRLFTRCNERLSFVDFPQAEMITSRLDNIYLQAKLLNINHVKTFLQEALDPPSIEAIEHAELFLYDIGALVSQTNELTPIGRILAHLPLAPQIGKLLILGYLFSCFDPILTIASILSYRDPFVTPMDKIQEINQIRRHFADNTMSDHLMLVNIYQEWKKQGNYRAKNQFCFDHFLNSNHMKMIDKIRNQLRHFIQDYFASYTGDANRNQHNNPLICALMCAGLYPNLARIRLSSDKSSKRPCLLETKFEKHISIHPRSINAKLKDDDIRRSSIQSTLIVYHEKIRTSSIFIHDISFISPYALLFFGKTQSSNEHSSTSTNRILVDNWININIDHHTNELIYELKEKFNYLVEKKALKKNICLENEEDLIETIIHFITKQDQNLLIQNKLIDHYSKKKTLYEDWDDEIKDLPNTDFSLLNLDNVMSNIPIEQIPPVRPNQPRPPPPNEGDTMERLFQALFYRIAVLYARAVPKHIRRLGETALFVLAIVCMSLLIYLHVIFNQKPMTCLSHLHDTWPRQGVLRVELFFESPPKGYNLQQSYAREFQNHREDIEEHQLLAKENQSILPIIEIQIESTKTDLLDQSYSNMSINSSLLSSNNNTELIQNAEMIDEHSKDDDDDQSLFDLIINYLFHFDWLQELLVEEQHTLEYSLEYGFLRLSPETRQRLNIEVLLVTLDITNNTCFGGGVSRFMLDQFLGYQEILMSSIKQLAEKETNKGYVRNVMTNDHFRFVSAWQNRLWWTYLVALCIMIIFTISISMLLRYSHFQIFLFIVDLLRMIEHNASIIFPAAPLLTVILALIGMEAIMSEFFNDASTAFYIILIVWISDQYDSICCHTAISKRHWVRFFYIYHFAFYVYHARYNGQYSGLALTTSCCFIVHSMFYFFHHFELPVIEAQLVHIFVDQNIITQATPDIDEGEIPPPPTIT